MYISISCIYNATPCLPFAHQATPSGKMVYIVLAKGKSHQLRCA